MSQSDAASAAKPDWTTRITLMLTVIFGVGGLAVEMYSTEMRNGVQSSLSPIGRFGVPIALGVLTAILVYRLRRRGKTKPDIRIQAETEPAPIAEPECVKIEHKRITIDADTQQRVPDADQVLGRDIHILESKYESKDLYIFLPGLGLDAKDFEPYMRAARFHCVALTLFGFNEEEHDNRDYWSITHQGHLQVIAFVLRQIHRAYPKKRIVLCGFSIGADQLLLMAETCPDVLAEIKVKRALLLDVNINRSTMLLSGQLAKIDPEGGVNQLNMITSSTSNREEFHFLSEYQSRICMKNLHHLRRLAKDITKEWDFDGAEKFVERLHGLHEAIEDITVVMSSAYRVLCHDISRSAATESKIEYEQLNHFKLLEPEILGKYLSLEPSAAGRGR
jgi:pimeloyl-ACP methyl ester carboxylesterase